MINLEYSRANTIGTIAMARTADLNSATSEWFINTDNNTTFSALRTVAATPSLAGSSVLA